MKTYRAAVIGCSRMGGFIDNEVIGYPTIVLPMSHAAGYTACTRTDLVACADMRPEVMAEFGRQYNVPTQAQYTDYRELIEKEKPDIVSVATQPEQRAEIVTYAAEHGVKAIYAEKAFAASLAEAEAMVAAVERNGVAFNLGSNRRWATEYAAMKALVDSGELGALKSILMYSTGTLFNMGSHYFDLALLLNNDQPVDWVQATLRAKDDIFDGDILREDPVGEGFVAFANGVTAYMLTTPRSSDCEIICEHGSLTAFNDGLTWQLRRRQPIDANGHTGLLDAPFTEPPRVSSTLRLIEDLVAALDTGQPTQGGARIALAGAELIFAFIESHRQGGARVPLPLQQRTLRLQRNNTGGHQPRYRACGSDKGTKRRSMTTLALTGVTVHLGEPIQAMASVGHAWFPSLAQFPTGELLLAYSLAADTNENQVDLSGYQVSADGGHTWTPRYDVLPEHQPMIYVPQADGALFAIPAYLYAVDPADPYNFCGAATTFEHGGRRVIFEPQAVRLVDWPWPVKILPNPYRTNYHRVNLCFDGDALLVDGRLLATLYGAKADNPFYSVVIASSEDGGRTWRYLSTVAGPEAVPSVEPRGHGPGEPSLVQLANGDLMCVMRMGGGAAFPLRRSYSNDGGRTWSPPDVLPAVSVEPSLKRLQNGVLALSTGRPGLWLWFATDGRGVQWQAIDVLAHHNQWSPAAGYQMSATQTTAYTELIEVAPNRLLLAYDRTPFGWQPTPADTEERNRIFLLPIEVTAESRT